MLDFPSISSVLAIPGTILSLVVSLSRYSARGASVALRHAQTHFSYPTLCFFCVLLPAFDPSSSCSEIASGPCSVALLALIGDHYYLNEIHCGSDYSRGSYGALVKGLRPPSQCFCLDVTVPTRTHTHTHTHARMHTCTCTQTWSRIFRLLYWQRERGGENERERGSARKSVHGKGEETTQANEKRSELNHGQGTERGDEQGRKRENNSFTGEDGRDASNSPCRRPRAHARMHTHSCAHTHTHTLQ